MIDRFSYLRPRDIGWLIIGGAIVALSGTAVAITDKRFAYTNPQTGYLSIHPMDLTPVADFAYFNNSDDGDLELTNGGCATTGINLPQGARIVSLQTYYVGVGTTSFHPIVAILRNHLERDVTTYLVSQEIPDTSGARSSVFNRVPGNLSIVKNQAYSYGFGVCLGADDRFEGARITYRYSSAGD